MAAVDHVRHVLVTGRPGEAICLRVYIRVTVQCIARVPPDHTWSGCSLVA